MLTKSTFFLFFRSVFRRLHSSSKLHQRKISSGHHFSQSKNQRFSAIHNREDLSETAICFSVEGGLLKSDSMFAYFMLVAFEAGSLIRALVLFLAYPFTFFVDDDAALNMMVMITFFGLKMDKFMVGRTVLPKFFLEDVAMEALQVVKNGRRKIAITEFPQVMVESFMKEYLDVDYVVGRKIKTVGGYCTGVLENRKSSAFLEEILDECFMKNDAIGITGFGSPMENCFRHCKEIYFVRNEDRRKWQPLRRDLYPNPLIFHDGRLAVRPTPLTTLAIFMWLPLGFVLLIARVFAAWILPFALSITIMQATGIRCTMAVAERPERDSNSDEKLRKGALYACNHRTLMDPLFLSFSLKKPLTAVTYSLSRVSEMLSPIRTVRLTRDRDRDGEVMESMLKEGDLVVCPEGTTCREPFLLRFSPLFAELSDRITPVAMNSHAGMFYGTTAGGLKCLDPVFFLLNPYPSYTIKLLPTVRGLSTLRDDAEMAKYDVANWVQSKIGNSLGFECTNLTRRDKYTILAKNDGTISK